MQNSKWYFLVICLVAVINFNTASPVPASKNQIKSLRDTSLELDDLDLASSDEAGVSVKETSPKSNPPRGKRTIGFLRTLFPNLSQIIDRKIQQITRVVFRVIGRLVLRGGNGGGGDSDKEGRKISITLPTYPPSEEDEEEETESPEDSNTEASSDNEATTTPESFSEISSLENADNSLAESQAITKIARKARDVSSAEQKKEPIKRDSNDVEQLDDKSNEDDKPAKQEDEGKSKRVLFKFGGSGGASGNLLFDLIRILNV